MSRRLTRRRAAAMLPLLPWAAAWPAFAQHAPAKRRYGILSLVGDMYTVVEVREATGSRLDRNREQRASVAGGTLDAAVLDEVGALVSQHDPVSRPTSIPSDDAALYTRERQQELFRGRFVHLPDAVANAAKESGATHVLLVTKAWERFAFQFEGGATLGQGGGAGLGFYVEARGHGFLGIYTFIRGTLIDVHTGRITDDRIVNGSELDERTLATPAARLWPSLSEGDKLNALSRMLRKSVREGLGPILATR
jgi:hypothetical protein